MIRYLFLTSVALAAVACQGTSSESTEGSASAEVTSDLSQETDFRVGHWKAETYSSTGRHDFPCNASPTGTSLICVASRGIPNPSFMFSIVEFEKSTLGVRPIVTDYFKSGGGDEGGFAGYTRRCEKNLDDQVHDDGTRVQQCEKPAVGAHPLPDGGFAGNDFGVRVSVTRDASGKIVSYAFNDNFHPAGTIFSRID